MNTGLNAESADGMWESYHGTIAICEARQRQPDQCQPSLPSRNPFPLPTAVFLNIHSLRALPDVHVLVLVLCLMTCPCVSRSPPTPSRGHSYRSVIHATRRAPEGWQVRMRGAPLGGGANGYGRGDRIQHHHDSVSALRTRGNGHVRVVVKRARCGSRCSERETRVCVWVVQGRARRGGKAGILGHRTAGLGETMRGLGNLTERGGWGR